MTEDTLNILIPGIIVVLILILIYRVKVQIRRLIKNEIYGNFPFIKTKIDNFSSRLDYLKTRIDDLEKKINELRRQKGAMPFISNEKEDKGG